MVLCESVLEENRKYWTGRAKGYSEVNQDELFGEQKARWMELLSGEIDRHYPGKCHDEISVLDIGCGPGFFSIILTEMGYQVTAVDYTEAMLEEAMANAGYLCDAIRFLRMNAEDLKFLDESFDVVVSRNLTWNLKHPDVAYREWQRVLRTGGLFLNFDANWYHYLFDDAEGQRFADNRIGLAKDGVADYCSVTDEDTMEAIVRRLPLGLEQRPQWDAEVLEELGMQNVTTIWDVGRDLWSEEEKRNYALTPMFMVKAVK